MFSFYQKWVIQKPWYAIGFLAVLFVFLMSDIVNLKFDASSDSLVLEGDKDLEYYREIYKRYGSGDFLLVAYTPKSGDIWSEESQKAIDILAKDLAKVETVESIMTYLDVPLLYSPPLSVSDLSDGIPTLRDESTDLEMARQEFLNSPIYKELLTSQDENTTLIHVGLKRDDQYYDLLNVREELRYKKRKEGLTQQERVQLEKAEQEFSDYNAVRQVRERQMIVDFRAILDQHRDKADIFLGGVPMIASDMIAFVKADLQTFGVGILLFILFLMSVIFRRWYWVVLCLLTCGVTSLMMLGLMAHIDWKMTVISSNFVALLLIITLSVCVHLIVRYRELHEKHPDASQKWLSTEMVRKMFIPCLYTTLTTNVAFASLVISGIRPVIDFGWMMVMGVSLALSLAFMLIPAFIALVKKDIEPAKTSKGKPMTLFFAGITEKHHRKILVGSILLAIYSAWGIANLKVENRFIDYFDESTEIFQGMELVDAKLGGTIPLDVILETEPLLEDWMIEDAKSSSDGFDDDFSDDFEDDVSAEISDFNDGEDDFADAPVDDFADDFADDFSDDFADESDSSAPEKSVDPSLWFNRSGLNQIEQVHDYLDGLDETGKVLSLATTWKVAKDLMGEDVDDIQLTLLRSKAPAEVDDILIAPYLNDENLQTRISIRVKETSETLERNEFLKQVKHHIVNELGFEEDKVHLTGMLVMYNNMLQSLFSSQILTLGAVFVAILAMFVLLFRSISLALVAIIPNLLAASIVLGSMGVFGIPLDIMTITIAAITVGIGVDDTIHYVHRFKREFSEDRNYLATMYRCHGSIGKAMFYTSVIIIGGFSILALSNFRPSIYFGLLTGAAMAAALMGALLLLPTLLLWLKPLGPEGKNSGREGSEKNDQETRNSQNQKADLAASGT